MPHNARQQARAIAITREQDNRMRRLGLIALAVTMTAACIYGLMTLVS